LALEADQIAVMERAERLLPTFAKAYRNMVSAAALLDMLPAPSIGAVGEMYQQLKNILGTATMQQAESSLQHQVNTSTFPPHVPRMGDKGPPKWPSTREWLPCRLDFQLAIV
jgi:hypothetical protein